MKKPKKDLSTFLTPEQMEMGGIAFVKLVNERKAKIEEIRHQVMSKFSLSQEQFESLSHDEKLKLIRQLTI